jgi:hypothetical protein
MEQLFEALGNGLGNLVTFMASTGVLFAIFAALWIIFGFALVRSQGSLDRAWAKIRSLPLVVQLVVWLLFLPVMIGLRIWESPWPAATRLMVVLALAVVNLVMFLPAPIQAAGP